MVKNVMGATRTTRRLLLALWLFWWAAHASAAQRYSASGVVLEVDRPHHSIQVSCHEIPGYMAAMVMDFPVRNARELEALRPGAMIEFTLVVTKDSAYADHVRIRPYQNTEPEPMAVRQLNLVEGLLNSGSEATKTLEVGQPVPDFSLVDQNRKPISLAQLAGKVVAITFIYTHCPLPNYCFRLSNNFGIVRQRFPARMGRDLVLLSVTFDPEHDPPEVLAQYARTWKAADAQGWHFLTGPLPEVQKVCHEFGMNFWQDEGLITHALHTVILDRQGKLVANLEGNEFTAQQLGDLVDSILRRPH